MNLFFDLDGTLTDSKPGIVASIRHALRAVDVEPPPVDEIARLIGPPTQDAFARLLGTTDRASIDRAVQAYRDRFASVGMFENSVYPGVLDGLGALRARDFDMWVVTSKPQVYAQTIVEHFGLRGFFREVYGPELSGERSDKGELIAYILGVERLRTADTWMIGDRMHDIVGAKKNGLRAAGVLWGYGSREELRDAGADVLYEAMPDLVHAFEAAT
ncbi:MAG TPA: HAD hydrolase-like protein [Polyangiaceae bacterium]|nr:HAD hydrolase-like protein [Polyangiaceae bacterium]